EKQEAFMAEYLRHERPPSDFWDRLHEHPEFSTDGLVNELEFTLKVGELTQNHLPLVRRLQQMRRDGSIRSVRGLANVDTHDWQELIAATTVDEHALGLSPSHPGTADEEQAQHLARTMEAAFPTAAVAYRLDKDDAADSPFKARERQDVVRFILHNPQF